MIVVVTVVSHMRLEMKYYMITRLILLAGRNIQYTTVLVSTAPDDVIKLH